MRGARRPTTTSIRVWALVVVGCSCGLVILQEIPSLEANWTATIGRRQAATTSSSSIGSSSSLLASSSSSSSPQSALLPPQQRNTLANGPGPIENGVSHNNLTSNATQDQPERRRFRPQRLEWPVVTNTSAASHSTTKAKVDYGYYSLARVDRSGASINHMVQALAYGYATNATYRGACQLRNVLDYEKRQADKEALIRAIGLEHVLLFACPDSDHMDQILRYEFMNKKKLLNPAFVKWLQSRVTPIPKARGGLAVVHVRRGDIDPCTRWKVRYLPVSYFVEVLRRHVPPQIPIVVYSESASFEPFTEFYDALRKDDGTNNVTVRLDTDVVEVWKSIMAASHVIMSRSSFAFLPAMLNPTATVLYPPDTVHHIMPGWRMVETDIVKRSDRRVNELAEQRCHNYTSVKPGRSFYNSSRRT